MAKIVGDIAVQVGADVTKLSKGFARAGKDTKKFEKDFESSSKRMKISAEKMSNALVAGAAIGTAALGKLLVATVDNAKELRNLSNVAGTNVEDFQRLAYAANQYGITQEKLSDILKDTNDKIGDFIATGAGPMADFFENIGPKVGVTAANFRDLNSADALQLYVSSLEKANVSQKEMTFYMEALASDASALAPLLANGGAEMDRLGQSAEDLGIILDQKTIAGTVAMGERWDQVVGQMKTNFLNMAASVLFAMDDIFSITEDPLLNQMASKREGIEKELAVIEKRLDDVRNREFDMPSANQSIENSLKQSAIDLRTELEMTNAVADEQAQKLAALGDAMKRQENYRNGLDQDGNPLSGPTVEAGGAGGGGKGTSEADLERFEEGLMSENELLMADYEKKLAMLAEFREQKKITEAEYNEMEAQITRDHEAAIGQIEAASRQQRINSILGAGSEVLSALGSTNDKAFKMAKVFNASMALMDAWGAYNKVLNDPTPQPWFVRMAAGATVLASAIGAVNSIKSATMGSGGGGASAAGAVGGGGSAQAAQSAPQERRVAEFRFVGGNVLDPSAIVDAMNEAYDQGYQIRGVIG